MKNHCLPLRRSLSHRPWSFACLAACLAASFATPALAIDTVRLADEQVRGEIQSMTRDAVVITPVRATEPRTIPTDEILSITYTGQPGQMGMLISQLEGGNYGGIEQTVNLISDDRISNNQVKAEIAYIVAFAAAQNALAGNGDLEAAGKGMKEYVDQNPQHWRYYTAVQVLGELYSAVGADDDAIATFALLSNAPSEEIKLNGTMAQAKAMLAAEKYEDALPLFEQVIAAGASTDQAKVRAMAADVGKIACQARLGQAEQGVSVLLDVINNGDSEDAELFAMDYTALGNCYLAEGKNQEALLAFLHVDLLYSSQSRYRAEALYHLSRLWGEVGQGERALQARQTLLSTFADSIWARKSNSQ